MPPRRRRRTLPATPSASMPGSSVRSASTTTSLFRSALRRSSVRLSCSARGVNRASTANSAPPPNATASDECGRNAAATIVTTGKRIAAAAARDRMYATASSARHATGVAARTARSLVDALPEDHSVISSAAIATIAASPAAAGHHLRATPQSRVAATSCASLPASRASGSNRTSTCPASPGVTSDQGESTLPASRRARTAQMRAADGGGRIGPQAAEIQPFLREEAANRTPATAPGDIPVPASPPPNRTCRPRVATRAVLPPTTCQNA